MRCAHLSLFECYKASRFDRTATVFDPQTGRTVFLKSEHTLYGVRPSLWAIILTAIAGGVTVLGFINPSEPEGLPPDPAPAKSNRPKAVKHSTANNAAAITDAKAAEAARKRAEEFIAGHDSALGDGNIPVASGLAKDFSTLIKDVFETAFGWPKDKWPATPTLNVRSYCHINEDQCVFVFYDTELEALVARLNDSQKEVFWMVARNLMKTVRPRPKKLLIAFYGSGSYAFVLAGTADPAPSGGPSMLSSDQVIGGDAAAPFVSNVFTSIRGRVRKFVFRVSGLWFGVGPCFLILS